MQATILLFDRFTALEAVGAHDALAGTPKMDVTFIAERVGPIRDDTRRLQLTADAALSEFPHPDIVVFPGGPGAQQHLVNGTVHQWLRAADCRAQWMLAIGSGSTVLAAAGLLRGVSVSATDTTGRLLREHGARPATQAVVIDGKYGTAADGADAGVLIRNVLHRRFHPPHHPIERNYT
ncbi:DJ-1/PfpI family protein [Cryobacterium sp. BB307]|uniref:DJ-1/PfpI family protein n=1 Tax=Cryobacterium sp. BB307 TaxID=2716317 RepID=UPI00144708BF|nr:DJ-1/PfpI family protein [Cryobacterium sp. BB307]